MSTTTATATATGTVKIVDTESRNEKGADSDVDLDELLFQQTQLLDDDNFCNERDKQAVSADERRQQRLKRRRVQSGIGEPDTVPVVEDVDIRKDTVHINRSVSDSNSNSSTDIAYRDDVEDLNYSTAAAAPVTVTATATAASSANGNDPLHMAPAYARVGLSLETDTSAVSTPDNNPYTALPLLPTVPQLPIIPQALVNNDGKGDEQTDRDNDGLHHDDDDANEFDMFSNSVSPVNEDVTLMTTANLAERQTIHSTNNRKQQQDWDDSEGYYKAVIGETIHIIPSTASASTTNSSDSAPSLFPDASIKNDSETMPIPVDTSSSVQLRVSGVIGKGVFSTVLKCTVTSNSTSIALPPVVALKCIRHNETMAKAATTELSLLWRLRDCPGIVPLLLPLSMAAPLEHKGHVILLFSFMEYNLRDVLLKFGKGVGLSLQAVRSYYGQLLAAATHLQKHGIIHADLKPDNILVSADFAVVQLADFGSGMDVSSSLVSLASKSTATPTTGTMLTPTPYLVSRFYRAPEIILGLSPTFAIDLWSLAVTVAELYLGDVLFRGTTNNDMLYVMQQHLGAVSNRVIRQHIVAQRRFAVPAHFQPDATTGGNSYVFTQQTTDCVTGVPIYKMRTLVTTTSVSSSDSINAKFPLGTPLAQRLNKAKSTKDSRKMIQHFIDLLTKCLALDPTRRIILKEALRHEFFQTAAAS